MCLSVPFSRAGSRFPVTWRSRASWLRRGLCAGVLAVALGGAAVSPAFADPSVTYLVKPGDTLFTIARSHQISVTDVAAINGLSDPSLLLVGQILKLPQPSLTTPGTSLLAAPYHSQFDGSAYAETNCGPTSLSMALGALGINVDELTVRRWANVALGTSDPNSGTTWGSLAYAARQGGATVVGPAPGTSSWTVDEVKSQLQQGHPVLLLVRYQLLPDHLSSTFAWDHYIVALGFDASGNLIYNDPAFYTEIGAHRTISSADLTRAWTNTSEGLFQTAMAISK